MAQIVRVEKRRRGLFGKFFLLLFWGFNILMVFLMFGGLSGNSAQYQALTSEAERAGYAAGTAIGAGLIIIVWAAGALILGLFVLLTRGSKVIIETERA